MSAVARRGSRPRAGRGGRLLDLFVVAGLVVLVVACTAIPGPSGGSAENDGPGAGGVPPAAVAPPVIPPPAPPALVPVPAPPVPAPGRGDGQGSLLPPTRDIVLDEKRDPGAHAAKPATRAPVGRGIGCPDPQGCGSADPLPSGHPPSAAAPEEKGPASAASAFLAESKKVEGLVRGSAAVSAPTSVKVGEPFDVVLRVSPGRLSPVIEALRQEHAGDRAVVGKEGVKLTPRMTARLSGFGFVADPKDDVTHPVIATEDTLWRWQVRAVESGELTFVVSLSGTVRIEGVEALLSPVSYEQKIHVAVSPMNVVKNYWQWGVTALLIPGAGALWTFLRKRKERAPPRFGD